MAYGSPSRSMTVTKIDDLTWAKLEALVKASGRSRSYWGSIMLKRFFKEVDVDELARDMAAAESDFANRVDSILRRLDVD